MRATLLLTMLALATAAHAQWQIQDANTTASLRGIHSLGNGIAWASGTEGTVLRTEDNGKTWQHCAIPPDAEKLDFRGVQAFDNKTAIVMSSGKGDLSRLYKTTDGCQTWKLIFTNPDKEGFWDAIGFSITPSEGMTMKPEGVLIGDPIEGAFPIFTSQDGGDTWERWGQRGSRKQGTCGEHPPKASKTEALFAASNESLLQFFSIHFLFITGGGSGARLMYSDFHDFDGPPCWTNFSSVSLPLARAGSTAGAFAIATDDRHTYLPLKLMIVGGDYTKPDQTTGTAVFLALRDKFHIPPTDFSMTTPDTPPHGYRSSVAYDTTTKTWITVGPNGTDISTDDGRNWHPLTPSSSDAPDADKNWNALSLPFVVGPHGRIGILRDGVLAPHK